MHAAKSLNFILNKKSKMKNNVNDMMPFIYLFNLFLYIFCHAAQYMGSYVSDQESNPCFLQWKHEFLTAGPPEHSLYFLIRIS